MKDVFNYEISLSESFSPFKRVKTLVNGEEVIKIPFNKKITSLIIVYDIGNGEFLEKKFL